MNLQEKPSGDFSAGGGKIPRGFSAMAVSAVAHALLLVVVVFAWPRSDAPPVANPVDTASFTRTAPASTTTQPKADSNAVPPDGTVHARRGESIGTVRAPTQGRRRPGEYSPNGDPSRHAFIWTDSADARIAQRTLPTAGARVWLIPAAIETTRRSIEDEVFNHLWQSTLFALIVGIVALTFRRKDARTRYWLWCAASTKFLIPIVALERIGGMFPLAPASRAASTPAAVTLTHIAEPFTRATLYVGSTPVGSALDWWPTALWVLWLLGAEFVVMRRFKAWRRVRAAAQDSLPATLSGVALPEGIPVRSSNTLLEPGTVGFWKPVLLMPAGIDARLSAGELRTIVEHEACHIRCRDNFTAAIQMLIEAVFWFHPLVWWIGARMVDERERACDEHVLASVSNPRTYADAILHVCQSYVYAGLATVPGVGGGDLRRRIERIMRSEIGEPVSPRMRAWLAVGAALSVVVPVGIGAVTTAPRLLAQASSTAPTRAAAKPAFLSASVKPNASGNVMVQFIPDAPGWFTAINAPAGLLIRFAYDRPDFAVSGAPAWTNSERFDITAKVPDNASIDDRRRMLQRLFEERFKVTTHVESRQLPRYAMRLVNRNGATGPHLRHSSADCANVPMLPLLPGRVAAAESFRDAPCGFLGMSPATNLPNGSGGMAFRGLTMAALAKAFMTAVHRSVEDQTGLTGYFDGEFDFIAEMPPPPPPPGLTNPFTAPFSSIFSVVPDDLGLKLEGDRGPVDVLIVDSIQHPTPD